MKRVSAALVVLLAVSSLLAQPRAVEARRGMVVSVSAPATEVGAAVLARGGNAVDATVATAFALAVTYPAAGNIGGGGFMLVHPVGAKPMVIDYRETAPAAATVDMFVQQTSTLRHNVVGIPGTVRGMEKAHKRFGKLPWKDLVMPAVLLAQDGFLLDEHMAKSLNSLVRSSREFAELVRVFGKDGGQGEWRPGDRLVQPDLSRTLKRIAEGGPGAFYSGPVAEMIVAEMKSGNGLITKSDLSGYQAREREPVHGTYRGYDVYGAPPPSSGGVCLVQMLNVLETFDLKKHDRFAPETVHLLAETMRRAYCDRAKYLGDPEFTSVPAHLTSKEYARKLAGGIDRHRATASSELARDIPLRVESEDTTHFSVIDADGMAVSNTYTLEHSFGSKIVVRGAGFLLNNEMSDFNWKPGVTDRKGRIGTAPNLVAPGKRMLSSQTPTILARDGKPVLVTGSPGGRTIINTVLCVVVNVVDFGMDLQSAVDAPRMHHQWFPDEINLEQLRSQEALSKALQQFGHQVKGQKQGDAHSIWIDPKTGIYHGAADRRIMGKAIGH